jgi:uncharacterized protein (TIGR00369 family)
MRAFEPRVRESFGRQAFMSTIGAELASVTPGAVEIRVPFGRHLTQQNDFLHAGVIASILDSACGYAALSVAPENAEVLSVEFKVNLLAPAVGESFIARAQVKRAGEDLDGVHRRCLHPQSRKRKAGGHNAGDDYEHDSA